MEKMKTRLVLLLFVLTFVNIANAQDKIITKSDEIINCKLDIIGDSNVSYYLAIQPETKLSIETKRVKKIIFSDGRELNLNSDTASEKDYNSSAQEKTKSPYKDESKQTKGKKAIKIDFLSPIYGYTEFVYEHGIKPGQSVETSLGVIGWGKDLVNNDAKGVFFKLGYKFIRTGEDLSSFGGAYIMPEIAYRNFNKDSSKNKGSKVNIYSYAFNLKAGRQWLLADAFLLDWYVGGGYGYSDNKGEYSGHYGFVTISDNIPLSFTAGLRIGFVF